MELIEGNIKHKFVPSCVISFFDVTKSKKIFMNDSFEKYEETLLVKGEYILCTDITKVKQYKKTIEKETYQEYCEYIKTRDYQKDKWIYNIIDGTEEQDIVLYRDDKCVVIPSYTWDSKCVAKLHILCLPIDKTMRCIRDLNSSHIELLEHMKNVTTDLILKNFGICPKGLKLFFHYDPSTYHLHIHFINIEYIECNSSVEYSHDLDLVIFNLKIDSDYYKKVTLNIRR